MISKSVQLITAIFLFFIFSCDKIEEAATIDVDSSDKLTLSVSLLPGQSISKSMMYDLSNNSDINKYLDNLKGVKITEAYYVLKDFSGTNSMEMGTFSFVLADQTFGPYEHNLFDDSSNAKKTTLDATKLNSVATKLFQEKKISIAIDGSHSIPASQPNGETVTVELYLKFTFTASAL